MTATFAHLPAENRFATLTLQSPVAAPASIPEADIEGLVRQLIARKWERVSSEYDDPLGMLFTNRVKQWTAGWGPASTGQATAVSLYVLAWDVDSWNNAPTWMLYENGCLLYQGKDYLLNPLAKPLKKLLEGQDLPFISHTELLAPIRQAIAPQQMLLFNHLFNSLMARPEMLEHLQAPLFVWLEEKTVLPNTVEEKAARLNRETLALREIEAKNLLVFLFRRLYEKGLLRTLAAKQRLYKALQFLQDDYFYLGYQVNPVFRNAYDRAYNGFRRHLTDGTWQIYLKKEAGQAIR